MSEKMRFTKGELIVLDSDGNERRQNVDEMARERFKADVLHRFVHDKNYRMLALSRLNIRKKKGDRTDFNTLEIPPADFLEELIDEAIRDSKPKQMKKSS